MSIFYIDNLQREGTIIYIKEMVTAVHKAGEEWCNWNGRSDAHIHTDALWRDGFHPRDI